MGWVCWVCGGDQCQVESAVSVGIARENITGDSMHYLPLLSPERLKISERFALGGKCY